MPQLEAVEVGPGQLKTKYPARSDVNNEERATQNIISLIWKNLPQFNNIAAGIQLLATVVFPILCNLNVNGSGNSKDYVALTIVLWYISVPIGAGVGALLNGRVSAKNIYRANGILLLAFGVSSLFTFTFTNSDDLSKKLIYFGLGVIMPGFIYGVNHVTIILHAVDNSAKVIRGIIIRWVPYSQHFILFGAAVCLYSFPNVQFGIATVGPIAAFMAFPILSSTRKDVHNSFLTTLEKTNNEGKVCHLMSEMRNESNQVGRTLDDFEEMKLMLSEDTALGSNIFTNGNLKPVLLVIGARILSGLFNNISLILLTISMVAFTKNENLQVCIVLFAKFFIGWIVMFVADRFGFNRFFYIAGIIWSLGLVVAFVLGELLFASQATFSWISMIILVGYWLISLGVEAISYNQLSEAFPLKKRAGSIALVTLVESLVHIGIGYLFMHAYAVFTLVIPVGIIAISCCLLKCMPNTHGKTLREARDMFNDVIAKDSSRRKYESAEVPLQ